MSVVSSGLQATKKAHELQPDLILLDIGLPELNGIEAARKIRELAPRSKILFVSENEDPEVIEEGLRIGGRGYVIKSMAASDLFPAIESVMANGKFVSAQLGPASTE